MHQVRGSAATAAAPTGQLVALLRATRPRQWAKNVLVFLAPAAAGAFRHWETVGRALGTFVIITLAAGATYLLNDAVDSESDRHHPDKRRRPVASGDLSARRALVAAAILVALSVTAAALLDGWRLTAVVVVYIGIGALYSLRIKRVPVVELVFLASGFVLRAMAGGVATHVALSNWFLVVVCFGALFVAAGKRASELRLLGPRSESHRETLGMYTASFLQSTLVLTCGVTVTAYCLWAFGSVGIHAIDHNDHLLIELTVVPVLIAVLHVLYLLDRGEGAAPEDLVYRDRTLQSLALAWSALFTLSIYVS